jgi:hypothetical protein
VSHSAVLVLVPRQVLALHLLTTHGAHCFGCILVIACVVLGRPVRALVTLPAMGPQAASERLISKFRVGEPLALRARHAGLPPARGVDLARHGEKAENDLAMRFLVDGGLKIRTYVRLGPRRPHCPWWLSTGPRPTPLLDQCYAWSSVVSNNISIKKNNEIKIKIILLKVGFSVTREHSAQMARGAACPGWAAATQLFVNEGAKQKKKRRKREREREIIKRKKEKRRKKGSEKGECLQHRNRSSECSQGQSTSGRQFIHCL